MPLERDGEAVDGGDCEKDQPHRVLASNRQAFLPLSIPEEEKDGWPGEADEKPVRARHVRQGELGLLRIIRRPPSEVEVDRIFGQDSDDRQDG